jgi:glycosyltransferase involved in cell wall biosynthesis
MLNTGTNRPAKKTLLAKLAFRRGPRLDFHVDKAGPELVAGWAWWPDRPGERIIIEILNGAQVLATVEASQFRDDLMKAGKGDGAHGFSVALPEPGATGRLSLRCKGLRRPFWQAPRVAAGKVQFHIDSKTPGRITGWAWMPKRPSERVRIEAVADGRVVAAAMANGYREDLKQAGKGDGAHAFDMHLPEDVAKTPPARLSLRLAGANVPFHIFPQEAAAALDFHVDTMDDEAIVGWIWAPSTPEKRLPLELVEDDVVLAETVADIYRQDLADAGKAGGSCMFRFAIPAALRDGRTHSIELRCKGGVKPFHVVESRSFAKVRCELSLLTPLAVDGSAWLPHDAGRSVDIEILLGGKVVYKGATDALHAFSWRAAPTEIASLTKSDGTEAGKNGPVTVRVAVSANGQPAGSAQVPLHIAADGSLAVAVKEVSDHRITGRGLLLKAASGACGVWIGERKVADSAAGPAFSFDTHVPTLKLADGTHKVRIGAADADGKVGSVAFSRDLSFRRFDLALDVVDDRIAGVVTDRWQANRETAVEIVIDDKPVAIEVARGLPDDEAGIGRFSVGISARWRDGLLHRVEARIVGYAQRWPERPILFRAGEPKTNVLARVEQVDGAVCGWVMLPWDREAVADVSLIVDSKVVETRAASDPHPQLTAESFPTDAHGFRFERRLAPGSTIQVRASYQGRVLLEQALKLTRGAFRLEDAGHSRSGACFVLPDPFDNAQSREEARTVLLAASAAARAGVAPLTIVSCSHRASLRGKSGDLESLVVDLVGRDNAGLLATAAFVPLPPAVLPSTAGGAHERAYALDLWARANSFSLIAGTSRSGILAYCATSRRQGLLPTATQVVMLADTFAVQDLLDRDQLLERPELLMEEALEKAALAAATRVLVPSARVLDICTELEPSVVERARVVPDEIGTAASAAGVPGETSGRRWLIFAAPLRTRSGLVQMCDALDRLMRRPGLDPDTLGVVFVGTEDWLRGRRAGAYLRERARKWRFDLRVHLDLTLDSFVGLLGAYAKSGLSVRLPAVEGTVWEAAAVSAGLAAADLSAVRSGNATDLADALEAALGGSQPLLPAGIVVGDMGAALAAEIGSAVTQTAPAARATARPCVSVCISHFNRTSLLRQALASVLACGYPELEIIVVDDGSTVPGIAGELAAIEAELAAVNGKVVRQPNSYLGAARNTAVRNSTGELIVFMDDDNLAHPGMIDAFVDAHLATGADIVTSRFAIFDDTDSIEPSRDIPREIGVPLIPDLAVGVLSNCFGDANMLITRAAFEKIGGFTEDFGRGHEDWELFARASTLGLRHELLNRAHFWYRVAAQSMLRGRESALVDFQRNIRAYAHELPHGIHRILMLAQGLTQRWDQPPVDPHLPARSGLPVAGRIAYGRVAVIMRTKDRPILLQRALDSVLSQTYTDWALVVVNDGGDPEPVRKLVEARRAAFQGRVLVINNPVSTGMENASNAGVSNSASEFLVVHDDDDAWDPKFLERCVNHLDTSSTDVGGVVTHATVVIEDIEGEQIIERQRFLFKNMEALELTQLSVENQFPPISFMFRRVVMETVGLFDGELPVLGDWDFHLRTAQRFRIDVLREPLAFYHHRSANTTSEYGNTVVAQKDVHRIQRALYINRHVREGMGQDGGGGQMLYMGEMHREVTNQLKQMQQHMHWLEKMLNDRAEHMKYLESLITKHH